MWRRAIDDLRERGYSEVVVWALETNEGARRFYGRCGCVLDGATKEITIGEKRLMEVRYLGRIG